MGYNEKRGHWPFMKKGKLAEDNAARDSLSSTSTPPEKAGEPDSKVREVSP